MTQLNLNGRTGCMGLMHETLRMISPHVPSKFAYGLNRVAESDDPAAGYSVVALVFRQWQPQDLRRDVRVSPMRIRVAAARQSHFRRAAG